MENYFYNLIYKHETEHWWYYVRRKLIHKLIRLYIPCRNLRILDVGCGAGKLTEELKKYGNVTAVDRSEEAINFCRKRGIKQIIKIAILDYKTEKSFDCIVALDILEHCADDEKTIKKFYELLKEDGIIIVFVPALKIFWGKQDIISHHFRRYTYRELRNKFEGAGFRTLTESYFNFFLAPFILVFRKIANLLNFNFESELKFNNGFINKILKFIFNFEIYFLPKIKFPFGVSLLGVYKKNK